jgi:hypothetical protein
VPRPPPFNANNVVRRHLRFTATAAVTAAVTNNDILHSLGTTATSSTLVYSIFAAFRIRRISLWCPVSGSEPVISCAINYNTAGATLLNKSYQEFSDTTNSTSYPAYVSAAPPRDSLAHNWQTADTGVIVTLTCPIATLVDIVVEAILCDGAAGSTKTVVGATTGVVYYTPLDGTTSKKLVPVSLTTITT